MYLDKDSYILTCSLMVLLLYSPGSWGLMMNKKQYLFVCEKYCFVCCMTALLLTVISRMSFDIYHDVVSYVSTKIAGIYITIAIFTWCLVGLILSSPVCWWWLDDDCGFVLSGNMKCNHKYISLLYVTFYWKGTSIQ